MKTFIEKMAERYAEAVYKARKEFRIAMGKKTIKIDGLQHFKLMLLKSKLSKENKHSATLGDAIEFLYDYWSEQNGQK